MWTLISTSLRPSRHHHFRSSIENNSSIDYTPSARSNTTIARNVTEVVVPIVDVKSLWQYKSSIAILAYGSPPLLFFATFGNTMSVITLQHPSFRKSSTSFILSALAISDLVYVDVGLMRQWIARLFNIDIRLMSSFACKIHVLIIRWLQMVKNPGEILFENCHCHWNIEIVVGRKSCRRIP